MMKTINYRKENEPWNAYIRQVYKKHTFFMRQDVKFLKIISQPRRIEKRDKVFKSLKIPA